jgi:hypothetical protein
MLDKAVLVESQEERKEMAGPAVHRPAGRLGPSFGTANEADLQPFLGVMQVLHHDPVASAFNNLLLQQLRPEDEVALAHVFEEVSTLAAHRLISEDLLFDAFAIDNYWEQLKDTVLGMRERWENPKLFENFEAMAGLAAEYREARPPKLTQR